MYNRAWLRPVELQTYIGDYRIVGSTDEAVIFLLKHWPIDSDGEPAAGRQGFLEALEGAEAGDARAVFIEACLQLEMHVIG
ncbi:DUF982 domain-containing protein [Labrys portucalensis]|uniref:DUF982 domain-containing protein n=1 Tax=Labrys neptuniae TaxID=376174 RepID=A0ABV6ZQ29_9HYPH|nr:DUF982 domain-containing protein [Labrys neptuniae]MDT3379725.1 DUF982 domain-containing protein [Labrys neptuniae]